MVDLRVSLTEEQLALKKAVYELCKLYPGEYWRELDEKREYPEAFVQELTKAGYLAALIPEEYGGGGLGVLDGGLILEEINRSGGNAAACHAQMYIMGTLLRYGSEAQKARYLPRIASGELRLQAFGVTEPNAGSDTTKLQTTAERHGDVYVINGQKIFISRVLQSDLLLLISPYDPARTGAETYRRVIRVSHRHSWPAGIYGATTAHDVESLDECAVLRPGGSACR